jgi:hypothetical protein
MMRLPKKTQNPPATPRSKIFFSTGLMCGFFLLGAVTLFHHEMWRDELQTWMTVKHSNSFSELLENKKYDGHPILWYLFPYFASKFTSNPLAMQIIHLLIAGGTVYLFTNYSPFSQLQKVLFVFGYFALYEYAVITRDYAIGIFFLFLFLSFYGPRKKPGWLLPCLLAICAQANVYSMMLSIWLGCLYFMTLLYTKKTGAAFTKKEVFLFLFGVAIFISGISFSAIQMIPPPGSWVPSPFLGMNIHLVKKVLATLWISYVPIPSNAMHFWQTNIVASLDRQVILSVVLFLFFFFAFIKKPLIAISYCAATLGLFLFFYTRYFGYLRHHGHLFIVFVICFWLYSLYSEYKIPNRLLENIAVLLQRASVYCFTFILILQVIAGLYACVCDLRYPFSASKEVAEYLVEQKLAQKPIAGCLDYVASAVAARLDTPIYYPQNGRLGTYLIFDGKREETLRQYGASSAFEDFILDRSYDYMLEKKEDVLLLLSFTLGPTKYPIIPIRTFTASIQPDEIYALYLMKYPNTSN